MLRLAYRHLVYDLRRSGLTVLAITGVVTTILVLEGFNEGLLSQMRQAVLGRGGDLIATQSGVANLIAARSVLPQFSRQQIEAVPGVAMAHPLTGLPVIYERNGVRTPIFLFVYEDAGGPSDLLAGHEPRAARELVVDQSLTDRYGLALGDAFVVSDFEFRIAGIAHDAAAFFTAFAFAHYDDLIDFYLESAMAADITSFPLVSHLLIELQEGADRDAVARRIEAAVPVIDVFRPATMAASDEALGRALFGPIIRLIIAVAYVIGVLVASLIMFAAINARRRQWGVLKALGFTNTFLAGAVMLEASCLALIAIPVGLAAATLVGTIIETSAPLYLILPLQPVPVLRTAVACLAFTVLGALLAVRVVASLDPNRVFES